MSHTSHQAASKVLSRWAPRGLFGIPMAGWVACQAQAIDTPLLNVPVHQSLANQVPIQAVDEASPLTRAQARESLKVWRTANLMPMSGELGDTPQVLAAREQHDALQHQVLEAPQVASAAPVQVGTAGAATDDTSETLSKTDPAQAESDVTAADVARSRSSRRREVAGLATEPTPNDVMAGVQPSPSAR